MAHLHHENSPRLRFISLLKLFESYCEQTLMPTSVLPQVSVKVGVVFVNAAKRYILW